MPRSSRLETHDHSTCGFMAWCRKSGAQVAGKLENSTAIVAADGEKSARIDLKVLPAFDKCPNEGKDEQLRSLLQHSFDELKLRYDGHVARFDCLTLCLIRCSHTHRKCWRAPREQGGLRRCGAALPQGEGDRPGGACRRPLRAGRAAEALLVLID